MIEKCYKVCDRAGMHMRPASQLAAACTPYSSCVTVSANGRDHNAKDVMSLLLARIEYGTTIGMRFDGEDEGAAARAVEHAMLGDFFAPKQIVLEGTAVVPGAALARALVIRRSGGTGGAFLGADAECARFDGAVERVADNCLGACEKLKLGGNRKQAEIFLAHAAIVREASLRDRVRSLIQSERVPAAAAVDGAFAERIAQIERAGGETLSQRAADLRDIRGRLIAAIAGEKPAKAPAEDVVLVAREVLPGDIAEQDAGKIRGIVTNVGGAASHVSIIARSLGIPMLVCPGDLTNEIQSGQMIAIQGREAVVDPSEERAQQVLSQIEREAARRRELGKYARLFARTRDDRDVRIYCNIETSLGARAARENGADGVGLFRTEYIYMNREDAPTEEEQFEEYRRAAEAFGGGEVIIRTLDVGADKMIPYLHFPEGENPLLGTRGIRYSLAHPRIFLPQLRSLLRASAFGCVKVMFPFVSTIGELREGKALVEEAKQELRREGLAFDERMQVGMMVELPSAAVLAGQFAREADFFSIGTNDLMQYTFAAERSSRLADDLLKPQHPAILNLVNAVSTAAARAGIEVGICGAAAESKELLPVWIAMGIAKLSVGCARIPSIKAEIATLDLSDSHTWLPRVLACASPDDVIAVLSEVFA